MKWLSSLRFWFFVLVLLLSCFVLPSCSHPAYAMTMYQMTEEELQTLELNLATLAENSKNKEKSLNQLQAQLQTANAQLKLLSSSNEAMENSLKKAETSLQEYEKEQKHKQTVMNRQRNTWAIVAVVATVWAFLK